MELKVYNKTNAQQEQVGRSGDPAISFNKNGAIRLNKSLVKMLDIEPGDGFQVAQDPKNPEDWFFSIHEDGLPLRNYKKTDSDGSLYCNSSIIVKDLQASLDREDTITCKVGKKADELGWYPIFTASAKN